MLINSKSYRPSRRNINVISGLGKAVYHQPRETKKEKLEVSFSKSHHLLFKKSDLVLIWGACQHIFIYAKGQMGLESALCWLSTGNRSILVGELP